MAASMFVFRTLKVDDRFFAIKLVIHNRKKQQYFRNMCHLYRSKNFPSERAVKLRLQYLFKEKLSKNTGYHHHLHHSTQTKNQHYHRVIKKPLVDSSKTALSHTTLLHLLQQCKSVDDQIEVFHSYVKLREEDFITRLTICRSIENSLKSHFPDCSVHLVGSSANGLGLKGCDADLSFQFSNTEIKEDPPVKNSDLLHIEEHNLKEVSSGVIPLLPPKQQLIYIRNILQQSNFEGPFTVIPGRCPILHFIVNNVACDLSLNKSSWGSTNLTYLCKMLDHRVAPLMQIIVYWAKHSKLVGGPVKFKSYSLFLLLVYFLQTRYPPILPTLQHIFQKSELLKNLENWSYDVSTYVGKFELSKNTQKTGELLREFFFFYENFDFSWAICPINSSLVNKEYFVTKDDQSDKFELNTICIQDPLNLNWNVTTGVNFKHCKNFLKALISVCEIYQENEFLIPSSKKWGLAAIIDSQFSYEFISNMKHVIIDIPLKSMTTTSKMHNEANFLLTAAEEVLNVFKYCLLFKCTSIDSINLQSQKPQECHVKDRVLKSAHNSDPSLFVNIKHSATGALKINSELYYISRFLCAASNTWLGRSSWYSQMHAESCKNIHIEHELSENLLQIRKDKEKESFYFICECYGICMDNDLFFVILKPISNSIFIPKLALFLKEYLPKFIGKSLFNN